MCPVLSGCELSRHVTGGSIGFLRHRLLVLSFGRITKQSSEPERKLNKKQDRTSSLNVTLSVVRRNVNVDDRDAVVGEWPVRPVSHQPTHGPCFRQPSPPELPDRWYMGSSSSRGGSRRRGCRRCPSADAPCRG